MPISILLIVERKWDSKMKRLGALLRQEITLSLRNYISTFFAVLFPVIMLILFGSIYGNEGQEILHGYGSMDMTVPSYFGVSLGVLGLMTLPMTLAEYREKKVLKRFKATPVSPLSLLSANLIASIIIYIISIMFLVIVGKLAYDIKFEGEIPAVVCAVALSVLAIFALGLFIASIAKSAKSANAIGNLVYFPMLFLSGASIPYEKLPEAVQKFAKIFPLTYSVKLIKGVWFGNKLSDYKLEMAVLAGVTLVCLVLSIKLFKYE